MQKSDIEQTERLARLETFNEKVVEPSLAQILNKLDGLVSRTEFNERKKYVDDKLSSLEKSINNINDRNKKLDGNIFIKSIIAGEKKLVGLIVKYTGLTVLIGTVAFFVITQFINSIQQAKPEMREVIKEVKEVSK
ncbi:hypothetical protein GWK74_02820 [Candidatus Saccharibacteria bacterium oral taxon 488]|nr:hypothetical protein GWK74_02665 [Candidatus Saccharibacteria bacterium oral taxon 488]QHU90439.1 hypothetical protein GWK74_02820 [Candidatus Saccharibacteria bacterium oral taxon 488]